MLNCYDVETIQAAGFEIVRKGAIDYRNDEFAKSYFSWGFKPPAEVEQEAVFAATKMGMAMGMAMGASVLDIGCGNGVAAVKLAAMGFDVTALDISPVFIEAGKVLEREKALEAEYRKITWICDDYHTISLALHDGVILLDPGLDVTCDSFMAQLAWTCKSGAYFFLRYKQGINGRSNWPWSTWRYIPERAAFALETHTIDKVKGKNIDEWVTIDFRNRQVTVDVDEGTIMMFSDFVKKMDRFGFTLMDTWGDSHGGPVTENSRVYAMFVYLPQANEHTGIKQMA